MARPPLAVRELEELRLLIRAHNPLVALHTDDEERADVLLEYLAATQGMPYFSWSRASALTRHGERIPVYGTEKLPDALDHVRAAGNPALYHFKDAAQFFEDAAFCRKLREIHKVFRSHEGAVVITGGRIEIPEDLGPLVANVRLKTPPPEEYYQFVQRLLDDVRRRMPVSMTLDKNDVRILLGHLRGLTLMEVRKVLTQAMVADNELGRRDIERVLESKKEIVGRTGVLEYFPAEDDLSSIAGLGRLRRWLQSRAAVFSDPERASEYGLEPPRGLLLVGVQGCGKSLCAKAVARTWNVPLIRLDPARLYNKYIGETEKNLRLAMDTAERLAPVVLWIDEIEKSLGTSGSDNDGGSARRVLGTFLGWLQEKKEHVFVVATSNDISRLPPELLRKGRFDEIFFVDLPDRQAREQILGLHLKRRNRDPSHFDLAHLAELAEGFSGAELEQAIVSALYGAFEANEPLATAHVAHEIAETKPLSVTMAEPIATLRAWAHGRTVSAD